MRSLMLKPRNPCPVCGAETVLAEIEPHPLHVNCAIYGYACDRCGPVKSLVVLRSARGHRPPPAQITGPAAFASLDFHGTDPILVADHGGGLAAFRRRFEKSAVCSMRGVEPRTGDWTPGA